ncbi:hypothetical protein CIPAW_03G248500 [Carya illinoinensis]|uniref:Uncharacterized protein n=1 Tax=Carya illinoinensis TaxID=32201 RepID=A0A8T1R8S2_CARIL|nr:hypothetical protein CIPAW_03G248500 [Carya illinoinensis]
MKVAAKNSSCQVGSWLGTNSGLGFLRDPIISFTECFGQ